MSIKHAILGLLTDGPLHGYGLKAAYEKQLAPPTKVNIGQIYKALEGLQADGHVAGVVVEQSERPDKREYTLTDSGRQELNRWLASATPQQADLRNETYLKLMVAWRLSQATPGGIDPLAVVDEERRACQAGLHELQAMRAQEQRQGAPLPTLLLLDLELFRLRAFHEWLVRCEESFRQGRAP